MSISTERKNLNLNKISIRESVNTWIEQDIIVPDTKPDAIKIVNLTVNAYITECEILDDKIKVVGKLNYYIIYKCNEGDMGTRGLFVTFPYTQTLPVKGANKSMCATVIPCVKNVIYSLPNERKISTKTELIFKITLKAPVNISLVNKFETEEEIECKVKEEMFNNIIVTKKSIIVSKEEVMLPKENEDFFEILKVVPNIKNTEYKESYNKIMVKGDLDASVLYLSENTDSPISTLNIKVPFTGMIELENINDRSNFDIKYLIQDFNIRPNVDITSTKTLTVDYQVEVEVKMFEESRVEYISDFYSQTRQLDYETENVSVVRNEANLKRTIDLKDTVSNILVNDNKLVEFFLDSNYISSRIAGNTIHIEGNAKMNLLLVNNNTLDLEMKVVDILVNEEYTLEEMKEDMGVSVNIDVEYSNIVQNGNDLEITATLGVSVDLENVTTINIVDKITEQKLDTSNLDSMNIYIVKAGDTLWSIAKRYKTSVDKIIKTNNIMDPDKLEIGQKILIIR